MRIPVKMNRNILPVWLKKLLPNTDDPRNLFKVDAHCGSFDASISSIKIDSTWKSTQERRHLLTNQLIIELITAFHNPVILEVGASSGSSSVELFNSIAGAYIKYYVTDLFFTIPYQIQNKATYFYHPMAKHCIMRASDWFIVYEDVQDALFPLGTLARHFLAKAPKFDPTNSSCASMLHPELQRRVESDSKIIVKEYDIFDLWPFEMVDIIKISNVLNNAYFSDEEIRIAIANLKNIIKIGGKLIITDNRDLEKVSVFSKCPAGNFVLETEFNGGTEISRIVNAV